jgi:regulatory protein
LTGSRRARGSRSLPGSRARPGEGEGLKGEDGAAAEGASEKGGPRGTAWDRALRLLSVRDRSRREIERRLVMAGFPASDVEDTLRRLDSAGLVDDRRFARAVVEHQTRNRLAGRRAVMSALMAKGVDRETAEAAAGSDEDEGQRALELAERRAARLSGLSPEVALRRLTDFLMRRGHAPATAREAASKALDHGGEGG